MFVYKALALLTTGLTLASAIVLPPATKSDVFIKKRQNLGTLNITFGNDGGFIGSDLPLVCLTGCISPLADYEYVHLDCRT